MHGRIAIVASANHNTTQEGPPRDQAHQTPSQGAASSMSWRSRCARLGLDVEAVELTPAGTPADPAGSRSTVTGA